MNRDTEIQKAQGVFSVIACGVGKLPFPPNSQNLEVGRRLRARRDDGGTFPGAGEADTKLVSSAEADLFLPTFAYPALTKPGHPNS